MNTKEKRHEKKRYDRKDVNMYMYTLNTRIKDLKSRN
jgi:hypothetical protein